MGISLELVFSILVYLITGAVGFGLLKAQISQNSKEIALNTTNIIKIEALKMSAEFNKKDIEILKTNGYEDRSTIRNIQAHNQNTEIQLTKILEQLKSIEEKIIK